MGTDRETVFDAELSGCGRVTIDHCEPDHGWSHRVWYQVHHSLPVEDRTHDVMEFDDGFYRVRRESVVERDKARSAWREKLNEIDRHCEEQGYFGLVSDYLNSHATASAAYEDLRRLLKWPGSLSSFRKMFKRGCCNPKWVDQNFCPEAVSRLVRHLGRQDKHLTDMILDAEKSLSLSNQPFPIDGEIIYRKGAASIGAIAPSANPYPV